LFTIGTLCNKGFGSCVFIKLRSWPGGIGGCGGFGCGGRGGGNSGGGGRIPCGEGTGGGGPGGAGGTRGGGPSGAGGTGGAGGPSGAGGTGGGGPDDLGVVLRLTRFPWLKSLLSLCDDTALHVNSWFTT